MSTTELLRSNKSKKPKALSSDDRHTLNPTRFLSMARKSSLIKQALATVLFVVLLYATLNTFLSPAAVSPALPSFSSSSSSPPYDAVINVVSRDNDPNSNSNPKPVVKVYLYDLPTRFTYGIIEQHSLARGGHPAGDVSSLKYPGHQHMGEWYLFKDLLKPESDRVGSPVARVLDPDEADFFYVPFFSSLSLIVNTNRQAAGSEERPAYSDEENQVALVEWLEAQEYWKRNNGRDHVIMASDPNALYKVLDSVKNAVLLVCAETKPLHEPKIEENPVKEAEEVAKETSQLAISPEEVSIWGVPLLKDDRSDVILLKFLRARDFKVRDAFVMLRNTIQWRKKFGIDALVDEDLGDDLEKVVFMHGYDREGHPVCYNVFGEFQNKELYQKTFLDEEKRTKFLRWRIQFLERSIRKLDFSPGGVCTIFQVNDLKNSPGPAKSELRLATKQALQLLQDNYPEFVVKQVFVNAPWWYLAFYTLISPFMTQRTKSKFVFASPAKSAETLFKYISAEHVPIQYGGLSVDYCECNPEFTIADPVTDVTIKPGTKKTVEIIIYEKCTIVWELRVVGWEVSYSAEFVPDSQDAYTLIIQKATKMAPSDEPVLPHRFKVGELGKILLTIDNPTSKKKRLLYRFKVEPSY